MADQEKNQGQTRVKELLLGSSGARLNREEVVQSARQYAETHLEDGYSELLVRGALLANCGESAVEMDAVERQRITEETTHRFKQSFYMVFLAMTVALTATVQGMDESVVAGAILFYPDALHIYDYKSLNPALLDGLVNSAPYLIAGIVGCWVAVPLNEWIGRRKTILIFQIISTGSAIWQGLAPSWQMLFVGRIVMGLSIGASSATAPVFTSESAPAILRGGLVMLWQTFTAFGVMMGTVMGLAFYTVPNNWRYMLASPLVPPIIVAICVMFLPESPRWLIKKGRHTDALRALMKLRRTDLAAARDYFYIIEGLKELERVGGDQGIWKGLIMMFTKPRNRFAALAAFTVMVLQQLCGVNILTFYISQILVNGGFTNVAALGGSVGFGAIAWLGNVCAIPLIDRVGRRSLLLWTFLPMAAFLLATGFSFYVPDEKARVAPVLLFIYLYTGTYALGEGPVPFTYSAEVFPLEVRSLGMAWGTSVTWTFSWALNISLPSALASLGNVGTFALYAGFCVLGWFAIFFFVPESKQYTLEELDVVFSVGPMRHARFQTLAVMQRFGLYGRGEPKMDLLDWAYATASSGTSTPPAETKRHGGEKPRRSASIEHVDATPTTKA